MARHRQVYRSPLKMTETRKDYLPGNGGIIYQDPAEFTFTTDAVMLAQFPHLVSQAKVLELGCGTGAVSLLLAQRGAAQVTGVDINPRTLELFGHSIVENGLAERVRAVHCDVKDIHTLCKTETYDLVVTNPPYRNCGKERVVGREACHEVTGTLEDFMRAAAYALHSRGRFALVQLPERFTEAFALAQQLRLQPKRLQWVHSRVDKPAFIFLLECMKNGSYGLEVLPPLILYNQDGTLTEQAQQYYR